MINTASIYTGATLTLLMAIFHCRFYILFKWKEEYKLISGINRRIFHTIHLALLLLFFLLGFLSFFYAEELGQSSGLAFGFNLIISLFWLWRTIWQIFYFKGKLMHFILIVVFALLCICYLIPLIRG